MIKKNGYLGGVIRAVVGRQLQPASHSPPIAVPTLLKFFQPITTASPRKPVPVAPPPAPNFNAGESL